MDTIHVDITPDKSLIQKLGFVGYRTEQAIAELLDNSIDAGISNAKERIDVHLDFKEREITIKDDGRGMDKTDLTHAMTVARGNKTAGKLGQFGIGMKSACSALGKEFTITTSKINSDKEYHIQYDENAWLSDESQDWRNFVITEKTLSKENDWHGTIINISELKIRLYPNQVSNFKENFGIRYSPYLETNQVSIHINTVHCKPIKPDIVENSRTKIKLSLPISGEITGYVALLKKRSISGHYGINLFRNKRLITAFEKFGFTAHPENAKIVGELHLDHVPVNINKTQFIMGPEYEEAENLFRASKEFKVIYHLSKSKSKTISSVKSVFDYFNQDSSPKYLDRNVRSTISKELLDSTEPFEIKLGDDIIKISLQSLENSPLYVINKQNSETNIIINKNDESFRFVKNPLFLIGMIASEVSLYEQSPNFEKLLHKRNNDMKKFLKEWSEKPKKLESRVQTSKVPHIQHYKLADELVAIHEFLEENYPYKFQFTALSTLTPYLHNLRGQLVYTLHTQPARGEYLVDMLSEFDKAFTIVSEPDSKSLYMLLKMPNIDRIIAIREYAVIKGPTIAMPEKAFVDLVVDVHTHNTPLDDMELRRMLQTMRMYGLVDYDELRRCGNFVKKSSHIEQLLKDIDYD
ncbi:MAG: ATP-binding protein [Thaumarchaeota archaeon]|nr:ATP-binding protein [Nitrososphaerota archaeon]